MKIKFHNSRGTVYYGMHFYPGVAEYRETGKDPYRVFLNEDTLRKMDPTFAGRPIYVNHVDEVEDDVDEIRKDENLAGWVLESFYNAADGKHWVKFLVVNKRAEEAIARGFRLSNAYVPTQFSHGGLWNGVDYDKEITNGEFEHLAIVNNPRYEESFILTPEQFKEYNSKKQIELERLANSSKKKEKTKMPFQFFKREKATNSADLESLSVLLPKSKREVTLEKLINEADEKAVDKNSGMADPDHKVKLHDGSYCNVAELVSKHKALHDEIEGMKKKKEDESDESEGDDSMDNDEEIEEGVDEVGDRGGDESLDNDEDEDKKAKKKALELAEHEEKEIEAAKKKNEIEKKRLAKEKADRLRNAAQRAQEEEPEVLMFSSDRVELGKKLF